MKYSIFLFECLVLLGVLEVVINSEWGSPSLPKLKPKSNLVCLLSEFSNPNNQLKRKPYSMSKTNYMLLKL